MRAPEHERVGLCASCANAKVMQSDRGSVFYLCELSFTNREYAKYPRLPVLNCGGFSAP